MECQDPECSLTQELDWRDYNNEEDTDETESQELKVSTKFASKLLLSASSSPERSDEK